VVFTAATTPVADFLAREANTLFAPVLESAILELWNSKWGGTYKSTDTLVEILADFPTASIQLKSLESQGTDWLVVGSQLSGPRKDILAYLWPGYDYLSWRYNPWK
jgi:hypothetical protein